MNRARVTFHPEVACEVSDGGLIPGGVTATITDINGRKQFIQVTKGLIICSGGQTYLPVGIVEIDRQDGKVLVEFPAIADSGAWRTWIGFASLRHECSPPVPTPEPKAEASDCALCRAPMPDPAGRWPTRRGTCCQRCWEAHTADLWWGNVTLACPATATGEP